MGLFDHIQPDGETVPDPVVSRKPRRKMKRKAEEKPAFIPDAEDEQDQTPIQKAFHARDYQEQAVDCTFNDWKLFRSTIVVLATGAGKTIVATEVCRRVLGGEVGSGAFLFLVNKDNLCSQALRSFRKAFPHKRVELEQASRYASTHADIVVASVQSLFKKSRLEAFPKDHFAAIGIDECHHHTSKNIQYKSITDYFARALYFGMTATPIRSDKIAMSECYDSVAISLSLLDVYRMGWLVKPYQVFEEFNGLVLPDLPPGKDWSDQQIAEALSEEEGAGLYTIASAAIKWSNHKGGKRKTVVFCPTVDAAILVRDILNRHDIKNQTGSAAVIHAKVPREERESIYSAFKAGEIRYLVNNMCLTEGFDEPDVRVVVIGRMTKNESLYRQMAGRGSRPVEEILEKLSQAKSDKERRDIIKASAKPGFLVVDLRSNKHKLACIGLDVLGGKSSEGVRIRAAASQKPGEISDIEKEMLKAEREEAAARKKEEEEARIRDRQPLRVRARLQSRFADPFAISEIMDNPGPEWEEIRRPTERQAEVLRKFGMPAHEIAKLSSKRASKVLEIFFDRRSKGLCSYRLSRTLARLGLDPNVSQEDAIAILRKRGVRK